MARKCVRKCLLPCFEKVLLQRNETVNGLFVDHHVFHDGAPGGSRNTGVKITFLEIGQKLDLCSRETDGVKSLHRNAPWVDILVAVIAGRPSR